MTWQDIYEVWHLMARHKIDETWHTYDIDSHHIDETFHISWHDTTQTRHDMTLHRRDMTWHYTTCIPYLMTWHYTDETWHIHHTDCQYMFMTMTPIAYSWHTLSSPDEYVRIVYMIHIPDMTYGQSIWSICRASCMWGESVSWVCHDIHFHHMTYPLITRWICTSNTQSMWFICYVRICGESQSESLCHEYGAHDVMSARGLMAYSWHRVSSRLACQRLSRHVTLVWWHCLYWRLYSLMCVADEAEARVRSLIADTERMLAGLMSRWPTLYAVGTSTHARTRTRAHIEWENRTVKTRMGGGSFAWPSEIA